MSNPRLQAKLGSRSRFWGHGSRAFQGIWVADFAWSLCQKARYGRGFWFWGPFVPRLGFVQDRDVEVGVFMAPGRTGSPERFWRCKCFQDSKLRVHCG